MPSVAISYPVLPGKSEEAKEFSKTFLSHQSEGHHEGALRHGFKRIKIWHQSVPDERVIIYLEADDLMAAFNSHHDSAHDFDAWMKEMQEKITGHSFQPAPPELLLDWHPEKGHSHSHHD